MRSSSEDVNLTRSKDVTCSHLELNGYAAFGHHAQFPQHHGASHVGTVLTLIFWLLDAHGYSKHQYINTPNVCLVTTFKMKPNEMLSGAGVHWGDAILLSGTRHGFGTKGGFFSSFSKLETVLKQVLALVIIKILTKNCENLKY